jgi:peptidoglycan/xylan/chitin deacetylase (PgdA/CDA1 family)
MTNANRIPILMYHDFCAPGDASMDNFAVTRDGFETQMDYLSRNGFEGVPVAALFGGAAAGGGADAARAGASAEVVLTFDDGDASHHDYVLPILKKAGFGGTFFVIAGEIGAKGRMDAGMIRAMAEAGMEIGSHGLRHTFLTALDERTLTAELSESRRLLEAAAAKPVAALSVPRGFYDARVLCAARASGFASVCVSDAGYNDLSAGPLFVLKRFTMRRGYGAGAFGAIVRGRPPRSIAAAERLRAGLRDVLGYRVYHGIRTLRYATRPPEGK